MRSMRHLAVLAGALASFSVASAAEPASSTVRLAISAQPIDDALREFGRQTGLQIFMASAEGNAVTAAEVVGTYTVSDALDKLLSSTGLHYEFIDERTIAIRAAARPARKTDTTSALTELQLEEVIVTAQKREERLRDVPSAISVVGAKRMSDSHQTTLIDYAATIPGLSVATAGPGRSSLTMRGLSLGGGAATVGTYIDDVPFGSSSGWQESVGLALELLPYDLQGIEALRGPQGTFYGANALGGLLKYVTKAPDLHQRELAIGADLVSIEHGGTAPVVRVRGSAPLVDGELAVRASYARDETPGYLDVPVRNGRDTNETTRQTGNFSLLWSPSDELSLKLSGLLQKIDSADSVSVRLDLERQPVFGDLQGYSLQAQPFEQTLQLYSATLKYDFGWAELNSATSFTDSKTEIHKDLTESYMPLLAGFVAPGTLIPFNMTLEMRKYTQELRLATPSGERFEGMLGAFFTYEDAFGNQQDIHAVGPDGVPSVLDPLVSATTPTTYREEALFGNVLYKFTDRFDVSAGVRLAKNHQEVDSIIVGSIQSSPASHTSSQQSVFNYSIAPRLRFNENLMTYVRVATGYRPGAPNVALYPSVPLQSKADTIINYEAGAKSSLFDGRVDLNVAAFQIDWKDVQLTLMEPTTRTGYVGNGSTARSRGVEWESIYRPTEGWRFGLAATYLDAVLTGDIPADSPLVGSAGDRLPSSPHFTGTATVDYDFPIAGEWRGALGGVYQYVGSRYTRVSSDPYSLLLDSYSTLSVNAGATNGDWSVNLFARNLTDERNYALSYVTSLVTGENYALDGFVLQPRTFGVSVDRRF